MLLYTYCLEISTVSCAMCLFVSCFCSYLSFVVVPATRVSRFAIQFRCPWGSGDLVCTRPYQYSGLCPSRFHLLSVVLSLAVGCAVGTAARTRPLLRAIDRTHPSPLSTPRPRAALAATLRSAAAEPCARRKLISSSGPVGLLLSCVYRAFTLSCPPTHFGPRPRLDEAWSEEGSEVELGMEYIRHDYRAPVVVCVPTPFPARLQCCVCISSKRE